MEWTQLGVLAGLMASGFGYLTVRMERMENRLDSRMTRMEHRMSGRFDRVEERLASLEERYIRHLELHAGGR